MTKGVNPIPVDGVRFSEDRVTVEPGVRLQVFSWRPEQDAGADPIFFVAGWVSLVSGWQSLLEELVTRRPVFYLETREKRSAEIDRELMKPASFSISRLADDLIIVAAELDIDNERTILFGSSMGSNAILEALKWGRLKARAAFLVGPNADFGFPWWGRPLVHLPSWVYTAAKPFVLWYLRNFRVNAREDPDQMARYGRTIRAADPRRIMLSARAVIDYNALPGLESISTPVAVAYARSDTLHAEDEVQRIVGVMPHGTAVSCPSNTYMHTAAVAGDLERFLAGSDARMESR